MCKIFKLQDQKQTIIVPVEGKGRLVSADVDVFADPLHRFTNLGLQIRIADTLGCYGRGRSLS